MIFLPSLKTKKNVHQCPDPTCYANNTDHAFKHSQTLNKHIKSFHGKDPSSFKLSFGNKDAKRLPCFVCGVNV